MAIDGWTDCAGPSEFTRPPCSAPWHAINCSDAETGAADGAADTGGVDAGSG